ncbi:MAG: hypothetical protein EHM70_05210 [Chloroflexota bacterium]|nr:MAG: hypothetical protein EHM70_05210 [Chloroflexota bacterium]
MFDDLRQQADSSFEEEEQDQGMETSRRVRPARNFLGMTPVQRFVIAVMVLMMTCILGSFCLLVSERIFVPFI